MTLISKMTLADWVLEVQLHNYTNPTNALYEELNRQYCCCENCKGESSPFCNEELSHLNCTCPTGNTDNCDLQLQVCSQYSRSIEKQCYSTDQLKNVLETEFVLEGASFTYDSFEVLTFEGYHQPDNVRLLSLYIMCIYFNIERSKLDYYYI